jgi:hypothetical protein
MTQDNAPARHNVSLTIEAIKGTSQNNDGSTQYQVSAIAPSISQYPMPLFIKTESAPVLGKDYYAVLTPGKLKRGKDGSSAHDYYYDVVEWDVPQSPQRTESSPPKVSGTMPQGTGWAVAPSTPNPQPRTLPTESDADRRERTTRDSIHRQVALKAAVDFTIAYSEIALPDPVSFLLGLHETLYARLNAEAPLVGVKAIAPGNVARKTEPLPQEQAAHLDAIAQEEPTPLFAEGPDALKDVGDLLTMAYRTWGKSTAEIMEALGVTKAGDIQPPFKARYDELGAKFSEETA